MKLIQLLPCQRNLTARKCVVNEPGAAHKDETLPSQAESPPLPAHGQAYISSPNKTFATCKLGIFSFHTTTAAPQCAGQNPLLLQRWKSHHLHDASISSTTTPGVLCPAPSNQGRAPRRDQLSFASHLLRVSPETSLSSFAPMGHSRQGC